jgi:hypothetical protein
MDRASKPVPEGIIQLQRQLEQFRSTHPLRTKLPEAIWLSAVELARQHGVNSVAHPLRLDYAGLKRRLSGTSSIRRKKSKPAFVELVAAAPSRPEECVIELESSGGSKMRIQWKTPGAPDWTSLLRAWRDAER